MQARPQQFFHTVLFADDRIYWLPERACQYPWVRLGGKEDYPSFRNHTADTLEQGKAIDRAIITTHAEIEHNYVDGVPR
jgi:hypothetical protein